MVDEKIDEKEAEELEKFKNITLIKGKKSWEIVVLKKKIHSLIY